MTIAKALKAFFLALNGTEPTGNTIADVVRDGTASVERNNESALATRVTEAEAGIGALETNLGLLETEMNDAVMYHDEGKKTIMLHSSTAESEKIFKLFVTDDGVLTATEAVVAG